MSSSPPCWLDKSPLAQATTMPLPPFFGPWGHHECKRATQLSGTGLPIAPGMCIFGHWLLIITWDLWVLLESN